MSWIKIQSIAYVRRSPTDRRLGLRMGIGPTRIVDADTMLIAGLQKHFSMQTMGEIGALWQSLVPHFGGIPGQVGRVAYGLCFEMDESGFEYLAAVEISEPGKLPEGFTTKQLPAQRYAVFLHNDDLSMLCITIDAIWHQWLPESGESVIESPMMFERYGEKFDPVAQKGDLEVWLAIK